ncbi:rod shape-determining protein MreD [Zhouia spongiae]|uniref:Rod shape-determining protein MreD n=1 Tax=Zhouia spongiae TaxID=2202721 RepID=A0ABY3YQZ7_9FLAO|nr:rod shape-determining protein MreD [Zhouia spongiae]UNZ00175.1 rod shape-determining protein MreD [Zhouia spongiae]
MNNDLIKIIVRFFVLILAQVLVFNHVNLFGYINPYVYILFILLFPVKKETRMLFIFLSFLIGLIIDIFSDSGGVHAAACVSIAYMRPVVLRWVFGNAYEYQTLKIASTSLGQRSLYMTILILTHHLILFWLEIFSFTSILLLLKKVLFTGILTLCLCIMFMILFSRKKR